MPIWKRVVTIVHAERLHNSRNGNPQWLLHTGTLGNITDLVYTKPDAQLGLLDLSQFEGATVRLIQDRHLAIDIQPLTKESHATA